MSKIIINGKSDGTLKAYKGGNVINEMCAGGAVAYTKMVAGSAPTPPAPSRDFLRLSTIGNNPQLSINISGGVYDPGLEYSTDKQTWTAIPITSTDSIRISLPNGVKSVYLRSSQPLAKFEGGGQHTIKPYLSTTFSISGHIASIIDYRQMDSITAIPNYGLYNVFSGISTLRSASQLSFDGITTVGEGSCNGMFSYNQNLTSAPALPMTTLGTYCYANMFLNCPSLATAPELPATALAINCYQCMFQGCTILDEVKISAKVWGLNYAYNWLENVAASGTIHAPTNSLIADYSGGSGVPSGWTVSYY